MENLLKIGQVCNLYGISLDTLRYYDRKGLLKPIVDQQSGYRYYSFEHLDTLEMLLIAKNLEIPLEEMKKSMDLETVGGYLDIFEKQSKLIEEKQKRFDILLQYTTRMTKLLQQVQSHENDKSFGNVVTEHNLDVTIYEVPLNRLFAMKENLAFGQIESFEQWFFYTVNAQGIVEDNPQYVGLSFASEWAKIEELTEWFEGEVQNERAIKLSLSGSYRKISFWGDQFALTEYLQELCSHFKLRNTALNIQFRFALLHKGKQHEYWADIYFLR